MTYTFAALADDYARRWAKMAINGARLAEIDAAARKIIAGKSEYRAVEALKGVPWAFVGVLHYRESSCNFRGVLHNGEKILGTGRKTKLVPAGRGPFSTWQEAAADALAIKGYRIGAPEWSIARCLYEGERFNGFGYRMRGAPSAYLWSGSDQYLRGKYVADGVWSASAVDKQMGIAPLMMRLLALDADVSFGEALATPAPVLDGDTMDLQRALNESGASPALVVDGIMGPKTRAAVTSFQRCHGLAADGIAGPITLAKLASVLRALPSAA